MKKRILAMLLSFCIIISMIPALGTSAAGTEAEFTYSSIGYQGNYPRYLLYLNLDVTDVSGTTVPDGSAVAATVNGQATTLWAYSAGASQVFLVVDVALGSYLIEIDAGTAVGTYTVKSDLKIKIDDYSGKQLEIIRLGIDTTASNGGVIFNAGGAARYSFYLTGISDQFGTIGSLTVNGSSKTSGFEYYANYPATGNQALFVYYNTLMPGATDAGDITEEQTISVPAGTIFGDCITENTLTFTIKQWTLNVLPTEVRIESTKGSAWNGSQYILYLQTDLSFTPPAATTALTVKVNGAAQTVYLYADGFIACESSIAYGENEIVIPAGTKLGDCVTAEDYTFYTHEDGAIDTTPPADPTVNFSFASGVWQAESNRYLVWLEDDVDGELTIPWAPMQVLTVDGADASVYATIDTGRVMLVLDSTVGITQQGEHTVTLKKGTYIGEYEIANDVTFYTHEDGTVNQTAPVKKLNFSFHSGTWQAASNRYLVWLEDDVDGELTIPWAPMQVLTVDGADASVYATIDTGRVMLVLDSTVGISQLGEHTVTLKKGTYIGEYEIANDVTFYTHEDGTVNLEAPATAVNFSFHSGTWQAASNRYLVWLEDDVDVELTIPWAPMQVLTVDGADASVYATIDGGKVMLVLDGTVGITQLGEHTITLKKGTAIGDYEIANDVTFYTHADGTVDQAPPVTKVNFTFASGVWQVSDNRYLVYLSHDLGQELPVAWAPLDILSVDGNDVSVYALGGSQLMLVLDSTVGITQQGEHTVTLKKGTYIGDYEIANDVTFYTHADGTVDQAPPVKKVQFTFASGVWQVSDNRYLVYLNHDLGEDLTVAWEPLDILSIDGNDVSVYATGGAQLMLVLDSTVGITQQGEHTVTLKKGTYIGEYEIANDVTFYTHADGTVTVEQPSTLVNFSFYKGVWQTANNRYLVWLEDDFAGELTIPWAPMPVLTVDGTDASVYATIDGGRVMLVLDGTVGITQVGEHTITLKKGTYIGDYEIANDVTFYTYTDGTAGVTPPLDPVHFSFNRGVWQYMPEANLARYLVYLDTDIEGELSVPWMPLEGLTVDGEKATAYAIVDSGMIMLILDKETGITQPGKYTVTLKQGTYIGKYEIAEDVTFYTDGLKVSADAPIQIPQPSETVTVENDSRNLNSSCTTGFYFQVSPADALPYDEVKGTISYGAATGGIYVNGELTPVTITKWLNNLYYVPLDVFGYLPQKGDVVTVDGVFGNGDHAVTFKKQSFVYDGKGNWDIGTYLRDLREQEYIVQDISELKLGLSQFDLEPGVTLLGEAKRGTNIAIRTIVSTGLETDEFNFGFSKIEGMWDVEESGWQVWLRPQWSQVFLAHGTAEWQATTRYEFTKEQFVVEFGTVDMHEYIDGKDVGLYCRKIFLKIDGVEVLSYKDTDLNRNVGKKLFVLNSEDAAGSKLISLVTKGVTLREVTPTIYDYFDLTGFAADTIPGGNTVCLGETATSTNIAVRMKMHLGKNATEVRLALSKKQKDNYWDDEGSGVQLWLRPRWNMLYIAHGENEYEVLLGHQFTESFTLEFGYRDVVVEQDGKYIGTYCREAYVLIDGKEIASWEDTDFDRPLGNYVMLLTSQDSATDIFTQRNTAILPVEIVVNGETVENCDLLKLDPQVVIGEDSKIALIYSSDAMHKTTFGGLYLNGKKLEPLDEIDGKVTYLLEKPAQSDKLRVELTVRELKTDEPTAVFDLFDMTGTGVLEVPARTTVSVGAMVNKDGLAAVNSAVRFAVRLPQVFNAAQIAILADSSSPWSNSGAMLQITPNQINLCYPAVVGRMDSFGSSLFTPGNLVCVEFGIVKCYENGVYKYDRWYVKAGETVDTMELIGWYDSSERGHYGSHFVCHGSDMEESYYLHSLKNVYSLTDESSEENKALVRTYMQLQNTMPELYYPSALVGYSTLELAEQVGRITLYTKPGTKLSKLTVNGQEVQFTIGADGAYCYTLPSVTGDVRFAYEITTDDTRYGVTASGDEKLHFSIPEDGVLAGDDLVFTVTAQKGYVPQVTVNGTEILLTVNEETGVWQGTVKSIRQDTEIIGVAVERSYNVSANTPENGTVTLGGDVQNGKLPFGGKLEITVLPKDGCYIQYVLVNGIQVPVNEDGTVVLDGIYWDVESIAVEAMIVQADVPTVEQPQKDMTWIWVGLTVLAVALAAVVTLLLCKHKPKEGNEKK